MGIKIIQNNYNSHGLYNIKREKPKPKPALRALGSEKVKVLPYPQPPWESTGHMPATLW